MRDLNFKFEGTNGFTIREGAEAEVIFTEHFSRKEVSVFYQFSPEELERAAKWFIRLAAKIRREDGE